MTTAATQTDKQDGRTRDNPAHAVLRHLAKAHGDIVKAAIREVTIERLESGGVVAGLAVLRGELFGSNGGGAARSEAGSGKPVEAAGGATTSGRKPRQMTLGEAARQPPKADDEVEEEEVEDEEDETPAPDEEPDEHTPLRRPIARAGKGLGVRKGKTR